MANLIVVHHLVHDTKLTPKEDFMYPTIQMESLFQGKPWYTLVKKQQRYRSKVQDFEAKSA